MTKETNVKQVILIPVKDIIPDENQPRRYFSADRMRVLIASIKREGIKQPLIVEEKVNGKHLLEDGERRYRAAVELGLTEVPALIEPTASPLERLIRQFSIQENHEGWTAVEKANAINTIANVDGKSVREVCAMMQMSRSETDRYFAYSQLSDKKTFERSEIPLEYATRITALSNKVKRIRHNNEEEFNHSDRKALENRVVKSIKAGDILNHWDITKLTDSFTKNPKLIEKYVEDEKATPEGMFLKSGAQGTFALRNALHNAKHVQFNISKFMKIRDVKVQPEQVEQMRMCVAAINKFVAAFE